jgi:hypothetical protein
MPSGTITAVSIQVQPQPVIRSGIASGQSNRHLDQWSMRNSANVTILGRQTRLQEVLIEEPTVVLLPRYSRSEKVKPLVGARQPTRDDFNPR